MSKKILFYRSVDDGNEECLNSAIEQVLPEVRKLLVTPGSYIIAAGGRTQNSRSGKGDKKFYRDPRELYL